MERNNNDSSMPNGSNDEAEPGCMSKAGKCRANCKTKCFNARRFCFNPDTKEFLGRTPLSWLKILSYYLTFYAVLIGFWAACLVGFLRTLDPNQPTMQDMYSPIKNNPGMSYEPFQDKSTTLISYNPKNRTDYLKYVVQLNDVISKYVNQSRALKNCSVGDGASETDACRVDLTTLGSNCTAENDFGYGIGKPCVFLRINKVFRWQPNGRTWNDGITCATSSESDAMNPKCEKQLEFLKLPETVRSVVTPDRIAVSCQGENDGDADNINSVSFYPSDGFPVYYFPYYNQPDYVPPPIMAQFDVIPGRVSMIWCMYWTEDVQHDKNDLQGSVHLELFVGLQS